MGRSLSRFVCIATMVVALTACGTQSGSHSLAAGMAAMAEGPQPTLRPSTKPMATEPPTPAEVNAGIFLKIDQRLPQIRGGGAVVANATPVHITAAGNYGNALVVGEERLLTWGRGELRPLKASLREQLGSHVPVTAEGTPVVLIADDRVPVEILSLTVEALAGIGVGDMKLAVRDPGGWIAGIPVAAPRRASTGRYQDAPRIVLAVGRSIHVDLQSFSDHASVDQVAAAMEHGAGGALADVRPVLEQLRAHHPEARLAIAAEVDAYLDTWALAVDAALGCTDPSCTAPHPIEIAPAWEYQEIIGLPERRAAACFRDAEPERYRQINDEWGGGLEAIARLEREDAPAYATLEACAEAANWKLGPYRAAIVEELTHAVQTQALRRQGIDPYGTAVYSDRDRDLDYREMVVAP